jgi:hypothetical protein
LALFAAFAVQFPIKHEANMELSEFLIKAKLTGYASGGESRTLPDGARELTYSEGEFTYRDRYFGFAPFVGEEVVFQNGKVIWAMNYYGGTTSDVVTPKSVYSFLQKAMKLVKAERPFRGPHLFKEKNFEYNDESDGNLDGFTGTERIFYKNEEIYRLVYHGGKVG